MGLKSGGGKKERKRKRERKVREGKLARGESVKKARGMAEGALTKRRLIFTSYRSCRLKGARKTERILITGWPRKDRHRAINLTETYMTAFIICFYVEREKNRVGVILKRVTIMCELTSISRCVHNLVFKLSRGCCLRSLGKFVQLL